MSLVKNRIFVFSAILLCFLSAPTWAGGYWKNFVYTMTNSSEGNQIIELKQTFWGGFYESQRYDTGGLGSGDGLGNQGGIVADPYENLLFVVNAGSHTISVFKRTQHYRLELVEQVDSRGQRPVSLTRFGNLLYVVNAGSDSIAGFYIKKNGQLKFIDNSVHMLSGRGAGPAQIGFSNWGDTLIVTEKATNLIARFPVDYRGVAGAPAFTISAGETPFGFAFDRFNTLLITEAAGGAPDGSSVSSYNVLNDGSLEVISATIPTTESAACWLVISKNGRYAFTTNAASSSISAYRVSRTGKLDLLNADGVAASTGEGTAPVDMTLSPNGRILYVLSANVGKVMAFKVFGRGQLKLLEEIDGLPAGLNGLASF